MTQEFPQPPDHTPLSAEDFALRADQAARQARDAGFPGLAAAFDQIVDDTVQAQNAPTATTLGTGKQEDAP